MYSLDRRKLAVHIYSILQSLRKTAKLLMVSHSTISRWLQYPERKPYQRKSSRFFKSMQIVDIIKTTILSNPFVSNSLLKKLIKDSLSIDVSKELIRVAIKKQGYTKKNVKYYGSPKC